MNEQFKGFVKEAFDKAWSLYTGVKNDGYNGAGVDIRDYWKFGGPRDLAYMCHSKALRAISVTDPANKAAKSLEESALDTAVDLINYSAFLYAEVKCRQEEQAKLHAEHPDKQAFIDSLKGTHRKEKI